MTTLGFMMDFRATSLGTESKASVSIHPARSMNAITVIHKNNSLRTDAFESPVGDLRILSAGAADQARRAIARITTQTKKHNQETIMKINKWTHGLLAA